LSPDGCSCKPMPLGGYYRFSTGHCNFSIGCGYVENPMDKEIHRVFNRLWITCEACG
jgi:hypothetical protein